MFYLYPPTNMLNQRKLQKNNFDINKKDDLFLSSQIGGWVYILKSKKDNNLYIGSTKNLKKRFQEHNSELIRSTKSRVPFELIYYEAYKSEKDARLRESRLKQRKRAFAQLKKRIIFSII